jgi:hypothetical protein
LELPVILLVALGAKVGWITGPEISGARPPAVFADSQAHRFLPTVSKIKKRGI